MIPDGWRILKCNSNIYEQFQVPSWIPLGLHPFLYPHRSVHIFACRVSKCMKGKYPPTMYYGLRETR